MTEHCETYLVRDGFLAAVSAFGYLDDILGEAEPAEGHISLLVALSGSALEQDFFLLSFLDHILDLVNLLFLGLLLVKLLNIDFAIHDFFNLSKYKDCYRSYLLIDVLYLRKPFL